MSSDEVNSLKELITQRFNSIEDKVDSMSITLQKDHDDLIEFKGVATRNKADLDKLGEKFRAYQKENNAKITKIIIGCIALGSGSGVGVTKLVSSFL